MSLDDLVPLLLGAWVAATASDLLRVYRTRTRRVILHGACYTLAMGVFIAGVLLGAAWVSIVALSLMASSVVAALVIHTTRQIVGRHRR